MKRFLAPLTLAACIVSGSPTVLAAECESQKKSLETLIEDARRCTRDDECALISLGCPFGCGTPLNAHADVAALQKRVDDYRAACGECRHDCSPPRGTPRCQSSRCTLAETAGKNEKGADDPFRERISKIENELDDIVEQAKKESAEGARNARRKLGDALSRTGEALNELGRRLRQPEPTPTPKAP